MSILSILSEASSKINLPRLPVKIPNVRGARWSPNTLQCQNQKKNHYSKRIDISPQVKKGKFIYKVIYMLCNHSNIHVNLRGS